jgi:hypothetical protein
MKAGAAAVLAGLAAWAGLLQDPPVEKKKEPEFPKAWKKIETTHKYIGAASCDDCHDGKTESKAYAIWSKELHARAFEVLAGEKAKEIAKARGIEDPQKAADCLKCHTTGYGHEAKWYGKQFTQKEGVSCEACHGAGDDYQPKAVHGKDREKAISRGLVVPTEMTCRNCHNEESPTWKDHAFKYKEFRKKIIHWKPRDIDKEEEKKETK